MATAYLALGSNLGERAAYLGQAVAALQAFQDSQVSQVSGVYETAPVGVDEPQPAFYNAVVELQTLLTPTSLLYHILALERRTGRLPASSRARWAPRKLDVDLLLYDDRVIDESNLVVPHPRMHERWFVLKPLCDINPRVCHPTTGKSAVQLLAELEVDESDIGRELPLDLETCLTLTR